jgi:hypothetical protein
MNGLILFAVSVWMNTAHYTFDDVIRNFVPRGNGFAAMLEVVNAVDKTSLKVQSDPETDEFRQYLESLLADFSFERLYESKYLKDTGNGFRGISYRGCTRDRLYRVTIASPEKGQCDLSRIGDFTSQYALKKNDACIAGGRSFVASIESVTATKRFSHRNAMAFVENALKVLDPGNLKTLDAPESSVFSSIEGESRGIINDFNMTFPRISELFNRYAVVRSLVNVVTHEGRRYTRCEFRYGYNLENLARDFPLLSKSMNKIYGLYKINMTVKNNADRIMMSLVFDSREDAFSLTFLTRRGMLIPSDGAGNPVDREAISLTSLASSDYAAIFSMLHDVHGLKFTTDAVTVRFKYRNTPVKGIWSMKLEDVTRTRITGGYYKILPVWLINLFIPNNMEQMVYDVSRVMLAADGGEGSRVTFEWDTRDPNNVFLRFRAITEFMDNYFLRYGLRVWSKKSMADSALMVEMLKLQEKFLHAFKEDLQDKKS